MGLLLAIDLLVAIVSMLGLLIGWFFGLGYFGLIVCVLFNCV